MRQTLIILRGGPASGKSTICEEIQKQIPQIVWLHIDSFKKFLSSGKDDLDREYWYGASAASLDYFLHNNFSVIAECIFQKHEYLKLYLDVAKKYQIRTKVYELIADPMELSKRDSTRKGVPEGLREKLDFNTIKKLATDITDNHFSEAEILNTTELSKSEIISIILKVFI